MLDAEPKGCRVACAPWPPTPRAPKQCLVRGVLDRRRPKARWVAAVNNEGHYPKEPPQRRGRYEEGRQPKQSETFATNLTKQEAAVISPANHLTPELSRTAARNGGVVHVTM